MPSLNDPFSLRCKNISFETIVQILHVIWPDFVHLFSGNGISENVKSLPYQGKNDFSKVGYTGPFPPSGQTHHYLLTLFALDEDLKMPADQSFEEVQQKMQGHILGEATLAFDFSQS